ncbi:MAG: TldD/PmbA family protein [Planctomycetota bacterium]|jgi:PmbA protein
MTTNYTSKIAEQADDFELFESEGHNLSVSFENDRLNEIQQGQSSGVSVRAVKEGKIGFSYSSKREDIDQVCDAAVRMAPFGKPHNYEFAKPAKAEGTLEYDERCENLDVEKLVNLGNEVKKVIKEIAPDALAGASFSGGVGKSRVANSAGQDCTERGSSFSYFVSASISEEGNFVNAYEYDYKPSVIGEEEILASAKKAGEQFNLARKVVDFEPGEHVVLLDPKALGDFLMPIGVSVNGINIVKKTSSFIDSVGEALFDPRVTIIDDPLMANGPSSALYDGEGSVTQRRAIIDAGKLTGFVHTLSTAQDSGQQPTGNAKRGVSSQPVPGMYNTVMEAGEDALVDLLGKSSLAIEGMLGTFTSNFLAGQVSGNISLGYLIKDGQKVGRIKNCALNLNAFEAFKDRIIGISKERRWVGGSLLPWVLLDGVSISGRS